LASIAYLTDVEGRWEKLADFSRENPIVSLDQDGALRPAEGTRLVFGGDAVDRGPSGQRVVRTLTEVKAAFPDRVVLLAGNRDINKMRLVRELAGHPPPRAVREFPGGTRAELLKFIFARTMGAAQAFEHRRTELQIEGRPAGDEDVVTSYLEELAPDGAMTKYLLGLELAHREGETLFVHGAVTAENLFTVPRRTEKVAGVDAWVTALNEFYMESLEAFVARRLSASGEPLWADLVAYQAPHPGTRQNQESIVYARPTDAVGDPMLPSEEVVQALLRDDIRRVVVGHTPAGDGPAILRDGDFELVLADNSYSRLERGARVLLDGTKTNIHAVAELDSGVRETLDYALERGDGSPIGLRDTSSGRLVKAPLSGGDYLTFRAFEGYRVEQLRVPAGAIELGKLARAR
jgi:hypothetical protein